jgi:Leu/Phe-tRNA-protein transferase
MDLGVQREWRWGIVSGRWPDVKLSLTETVSSTVLDPALVLRAYREGIFPMAMESGEIAWFSPDPRGVIPLDDFHIPSRLARVFARPVPDRLRLESRHGTCASGDDDGTWISETILECYVALHRLGIAHSVETAGRRLVYGVHLGARSSANRCFTARPMRRRSPSSRWSIACGAGFSSAGHSVVTLHLEQFRAITPATSI